MMCQKLQTVEGISKNLCNFMIGGHISARTIQKEDFFYVNGKWVII